VVHPRPGVDPRRNVPSGRERGGGVVDGADRHEYLPDLALQRRRNGQRHHQPLEAAEVAREEERPHEAAIVSALRNRLRRLRPERALVE
jgi:hypothetical protein